MCDFRASLARVQEDKNAFSFRGGCERINAQSISAWNTSKLYIS